MKLRHLATALAILPLIGCFSGRVRIEDLTENGALEVRLDANARAHEPGRKIKFFVDITNRTRSTIDLADLKVELQAFSEAASDSVRLRQDWSYRWGREMLLAPGKRVTVPIVPEPGAEFRLELLQEGNYGIVAVVNERHASPPYSLLVTRPDLAPELRRV